MTAIIILYPILSMQPSNDAPLLSKVPLKQPLTMAMAILHYFDELSVESPDMQFFGGSLGKRQLTDEGFRHILQVTGLDPDSRQLAPILQGLISLQHQRDNSFLKAVDSRRQRKAVDVHTAEIATHVRGLGITY